MTPCAQESSVTTSTATVTRGSSVTTSTTTVTTSTRGAWMENALLSAVQRCCAAQWWCLCVISHLSHWIIAFSACIRCGMPPCLAAAAHLQIHRDLRRSRIGARNELLWHHCWQRKRYLGGLGGLARTHATNRLHWAPVPHPGVRFPPGSAVRWAKTGAPPPGGPTYRFTGGKNTFECGSKMCCSLLVTCVRATPPIALDHCTHRM